MRTKFILNLLFVFTLFIIGCTGDTNNENEGLGRLTVQLTDAPFPSDFVAEANVTIFKVDARNKDNEDMDENSSDDTDMDDENDSPFITLMEEEITVNLLDLTNGNMELLADLEVPVGTYDLIRVYAKGINVVLDDGRTFDLKVPSGEQTGIKVFIKPSIAVIGGLSSDLLLDFDVSRSFIVKGNTKTPDGINGFNFKPVIKVSNLSTSGTLSGSATTLEEEMQVALEGAQISVIVADTLNTTGFSDADGNYTILGLEAGAYKVFAELEGYVASDSVEVQINTANKTIQDFVLEVESAN
ncbi:hypothetical protein DKG77_09225 [Flagellimonas aquimarina]|uniref:DUF4382 domain-containing protein n=1 Tax=Flagellimonas aquimarina TaxID=2201895 RepID=A0A316KW27_9FLAO|nr:DUF4382 domain-containing protein [Allomuricauda koreensis]PWL38437.1 hypothetical protein DKG77_09225 [Allomuricauda koreensis]